MMTMLICEQEIKKSLKVCALTEPQFLGVPLFKPEELDSLKESLSNVREIDLSNNQFINDWIFTDVVESLVNVASIVLNGCKIYCMQYGSDSEAPSPSRLTRFLTIALLTYE